MAPAAVLQAISSDMQAMRNSSSEQGLVQILRLRSFCLVKLRVAAPQVALGLVKVTLHQVIVMNAAY